MFFRVPKCATTAASGFLCSQGWRMPPVYAHATPVEAIAHLKRADGIVAEEVLRAVTQGRRYASVRSPLAWYRSLYGHVCRLRDGQCHPLQVYREGHQDWNVWFAGHVGTWSRVLEPFLVAPITLLNVQSPADFAFAFADVCGVSLKRVNAFGLHNTGAPAPRMPWTDDHLARVQLADGALCARLDIDVEAGPRWIQRAIR